ncbi:MAG: XdhC family protein [Ferruginibacter sp.]
MHKQLPAWQLIQKNLQQNIEIMLLYVLESKGSSPGRQGFMMAVNASGEMSGSLGGGIMEHKFVEMAKAKLKQRTEEISIHHQLHDKQAAKNQSGMICSGEQTIFLYTVQSKDAGVIGSLIQSFQQNENGTLQLSPQGISFSESVPVTDYSLDIQSEEAFIYTEKTGYKNHLFIIGGGHCALALSKLMSEMNFYIHLFDDRTGLHTIEQNHFVHEKNIVDDFSVLSQMIPPGNNIYVVIMTVGYRTDKVALKSLLGKDFKYFGILGSKFKIDKMFSGMQQEGIDRGILDSIHAPVGLSIKSETPEEIAVSIAAEIIQAKNQKI